MQIDGQSEIQEIRLTKAPDGRNPLERQKGLFISAETRGNEKRMILLQNFLSKRPLPSAAGWSISFKERMFLPFKSTDVKGHCLVRESNPGRQRGRRAFYHWINNAWSLLSDYCIKFNNRDCFARPHPPSAPSPTHKGQSGRLVWTFPSEWIIFLFCVVYSFCGLCSFRSGWCGHMVIFWDIF